jgi:hypothetical protein
MTTEDSSIQVIRQQTDLFRLYVLSFKMPVLAVTISGTVLAQSFTPVDVLSSVLTHCGPGMTQFRKRA